jgi:hypothetical protein
MTPEEAPPYCLRDQVGEGRPAKCPQSSFMSVHPWLREFPF